MKKTIPMILAAAAIALAACSKDGAEAPSATDGEGVIEISVAPQEGPGTKAVSAYTTAQTYETQLNSVQVFVFGDDGKLNAYRAIGSATSVSISVTTGEKTVYAVANGPDLKAVKTLTELESTALDLSANSTDASKGFVMAGKKSCTVSSGTTPSNCSVAVSRLAVRVALQSVTNSLPSAYGALKVERVFLANVVGNQNIAGTAAASTWYNQEGRKDETARDATHIIDGSTYKASCPELTFRTVGTSVNNGASLTPSTPYLMYSYPNSSTVTSTGFHAAFSAQRTVLVIAATVDGKLGYYPVILDRSILERNTTYTVAVTITDVGSSDPGKEVEKGSISVSVSVDGWKTGSTYDETI